MWSRNGGFYIGKDYVPKVILILKFVVVDIGTLLKWLPLNMENVSILWCVVKCFHL